MFWFDYSTMAIPPTPGKHSASRARAFLEQQELDKHNKKKEEEERKRKPKLVAYSCHLVYIRATIRAITNHYVLQETNSTESNIPSGQKIETDH